jgi:hypothetical protein
VDQGGSGQLFPGGWSRTEHGPTNLAALRAKVRKRWCPVVEVVAPGCTPSCRNASSRWLAPPRVTAICVSNHGAASRGTALGISNLASKRVESAVQANPKLRPALLDRRSRPDERVRVERVRAAGVAGLIFTGITPSRGVAVGVRRPFRAASRWAPRPATRQRSSVGLAGSPDLSAQANCPTWLRPIRCRSECPRLRSGESAALWAKTPPTTWEDVSSLRNSGGFMIKGVTRIDASRRAVDAGRRDDDG